MPSLHKGLVHGGAKITPGNTIGQQRNKVTYHYAVLLNDLNVSLILVHHWIIQLYVMRFLFIFCL